MEIDHGLNVLVQSADVERVQVQRPVRERYALGRAGAAAGVEQLGDGHFIVGKNVGALGLAFRDELLVAQVGAGDFFVNGDPPLNRPAACAKLFDHRDEVGFKHQNLRAGMIQDVDQFRLRETDIQGHHDSARLHHAVVALEQLVIIKAEIGHAISG